MASVRAASLVMWANATKRDPVIVLEENLPVTTGKEANARTGAAQAGRPLEVQFDVRTGEAVADGDPFHGAAVSFQLRGAAQFR